MLTVSSSTSKKTRSSPTRKRYCGHSISRKRLIRFLLTFVGSCRKCFSIASRMIFRRRIEGFQIFDRVVSENERIFHYRNYGLKYGQIQLSGDKECASPTAQLFSQNVHEIGGQRTSFSFAPCSADLPSCDSIFERNNIDSLDPRPEL